MSGPNLTKVEKLQVNALRAILSPWGLRTEVVMGGKHVVMKVQDRRGGIHRLIISCTPRCGEHATNMNEQKARRLLRQINAREGY